MTECETVGPRPPQCSQRFKDKHGTDKTRVPRIDVVVTVPGKDGLQWLDVTKRRPTAVANVEGAARLGGFAAPREREKTKKKNMGKETKFAPTR